jgi:hypothetical protein
MLTARSVARPLAWRLPGTKQLLLSRQHLASELAELVATRDQLLAENERMKEQEAGAQAELIRLRGRFPAGHYYSPLPDLDWVREHEHILFADRCDVAGIDIQIKDQLSLLENFVDVMPEDTFPGLPNGQSRYYYRNDWFWYGDAIILHCMLRHIQPSRLIEVGSGFSSAVALDTNERYLKWGTECTFVEPEPERLLSLLHDGDEEQVQIVATPAQQIGADFFLDQLNEGDILFIDSSHVSKVGSDVNLLALEVLPRLRPGVLIHIHDVFWPFEYPKWWIEEGRAWTELYLIRALLTGTDRFRIAWFNHYLWTHHADQVGRTIPCWRDHGAPSSLWLEVR